MGGDGKKDRFPLNEPVRAISACTWQAAGTFALLTS